ncbi:MAG: protease modulator HflC, partial [Pseudomonadota bacterium]
VAFGPVIQQTSVFDKRILNLIADQKEVLAADQKRLIVNAFAKYRISDPLQFFKTVRDESGALARLNSMMESSLRSTIAEIPLSALLSERRSEIMQDIAADLNRRATDFGVDVIDVRIMRADLPYENSNAIYHRMRTDREKQAKEIRAQGEEESQRIKSSADREKTVLLAESMRDAESIKGNGDKTATKIYGDSFKKDPKFFDFYRSMEVYRDTLNADHTRMILSSDHELLKHLRND